MHSIVEWRSGRSGHLPLQDEDVTTEMVKGWKKVNTIAHYHIADGASMALVQKRNKNDYIREVHGKPKNMKWESIVIICNAPCKLLWKIENHNT